MSKKENIKKEIVKDIEEVIIEDTVVTKLKNKKLPLIINIFKNIRKKDNKLIINGICLIKIIGKKQYSSKDIKLEINNEEYDLNFKNGFKIIKGFRLNKYKIEIPLNKISNMDIQNKILVKYEDLEPGRIVYNLFDMNKTGNRSSKVIKYNNRAIYLRQTVKNTMYLTVREITPYDDFKGKTKITVGYVLSNLMIFKKDFILLFEKEASRYEESASVLYEKLIDMGYKNIYYIINKDNIILKDIKEKYKKNILYKGTLKHIAYFFKCKKFIGTEALGHAMQLRVANKLVVDKIKSKKNKYVFLQHGVMYMVSLSSDLRTGFKKLDMDLHKIVVSSEEEANHFVELGGFDKEDLYICGLPKFDTAVKYDNADKIVIMPTWRRWEANEASINYENTKYYKMIKRIVEAIPEKLHDKVIILPHPLMLKEIKNNKEYKKYIPKNEFTYDDILKECKLLITDYSSIAYDAYFRGSNVIFYWEEKEECMKQYGEKAKLMLNEENAFADICYDKEKLSKVVEKNYYEKRNKANEKKYKKIVQFEDRKNTERLIDMLKKDGIL